MLLEIANKKVGIKFNNYAVEQLGTLKRPEKSFYGNIAIFIWSGYLGWCFVKQHDTELTFEEVSDWSDSSINDESVAEQIRQIFELYQQSQAYKNLQKKSELNGQLQPADAPSGDVEK